MWMRAGAERVWWCSCLGVGDRQSINGGLRIPQKHCLANFRYLLALLGLASAERGLAAEPSPIFTSLFPYHSRISLLQRSGLRGQTPDASDGLRIGQASVDALQEPRPATGAKRCRAYFETCTGQKNELPDYEVSLQQSGYRRYRRQKLKILHSDE
jgi:hypothetical protein